MSMHAPGRFKRAGSVILAATLLAGCGLHKASAPAPVVVPTASEAPTVAASPSATPSPSETPSAMASHGPVTGDLTVLAAASLTEIFQKLGPVFEAANPGVHVKFSFGGSPALAAQIVAKAPADVFAAASPATMKTVTDAGDAAGTPAVFVRNQLQIAVPPTNPGNVTGLADFGKSGLKIVVCAVAVPCGAAADKVFKAAGITPAIASYEQDVKGVLTKVELGEADAGLVYKTDVRSAGDKVKGVDFPEASKAVNDYPIVALTTGANPAAAAAWVAFITSAAAKQALADAGFLVP